MDARKPHGALQIIRDEHFTLGTVLHSLQQTLRRGPGDLFTRIVLHAPAPIGVGPG